MADVVCSESKVDIERSKPQSFHNNRWLAVRKQSVSDVTSHAMCIAKGGANTVVICNEITFFSVAT